MRRMTTTEFEAFVASHAKMPLEDLLYSVIGLSGETGEVCEWVKKVVCRGDVTAGVAEDLKLELGDVLHYVTRISLKFGWTLQDLLDANKAKLDNRPTWS